MSHGPVWDRLGLEPTNDTAVIRRAYAALIRQYRPDSHPAEFSQIREAYETAMQLARDLPEASPQPEDSGEARTRTRELDPEPEPGFASTAPDALPAAPAFDASHSIQALHDCQRDAGDEAARSLLHEQVAGLALQTIDARLDYEAHLLHWLLASEEPPMAVVFEGARLLRWPERHDDVAQIFGDGGARRLGLLMEMSYEYTYARHFSSNRWHRRLFAPPPARIPVAGSLAHVLNARATAGYWLQLCATGGLQRQQEWLNTLAMRRLQGRLFYSTDVLLALAVGGMAWLQAADLSSALAWWRSLGIAVLVGALFLPAPLGWRWLTATQAFQKLKGLREALSHVPVVISAIAFCVLLFMAFMASDDANPVAVRYIGRTALVLLAVLLAGGLLGGLWWLLRGIELAVMTAWLSLLRSSDAHAFEQVRLTREPGWRPPTLAARMRSLPAAVKLRWAARRRARQVQAQRQRESDARAKAGQAVFSSSGGASVHWWWILAGLVALANLFKALPK